MAIATVIQGTIETEDGKVFEFDSFKTSVWLESATSFRFEPTGANKPYTVRKESRPGGDYWYGYRKVAGKLHKKYIGRTPELNTARLEEIAETLNIPPQSRVTKQVIQKVDIPVTHEIPGTHDIDRLTALEAQMQALQESLEALRNIVLGKSEGLSDSLELLKPSEVTDNELHTELSNFKTENEYLRQQLVEVYAENQRLHNDLGNSQAEVAELRSQVQTLKVENEALRTAQPAAEFELPEPAELLNLLKARRRKATASLADVEAILEILEES
jgi:hypothetical protein